MSEQFRLFTVAPEPPQAVRQPDNIARLTTKERHKTIECIHAHDPDGAERIRREHLRHSRDLLQAHIRAQA